ncbi:DDE superfamily endonuclease [Trichinella nativa]|uniref:DDE superfamily endonuclease n=1 Tax=Trichinella nativa TaxID=6335 RepID=A0A1Y3EAG5_9BILA|nr:DDE superfamily endonuclease [Trichinella nativa]
MAPNYDCSETSNHSNHVDENPNMKRIDIARMMKIPSSTLNTILAKRTTLESACNDGNSSTRKRIRSGNFAELEEVLLKWFKQVRTSNIPVDGTVVRSKAAELAHMMGINDFKASNGWINRFRERHGLVYRSVRGEAAGVNRYTVDTWKDRLQVLLNDYRPDDVFNADEMGLFYRILPDKTLTFKGENCSGGKLSKERLTVLLCCNESGTEMLKPLVIGKAKNPRCFKNVRTFPCTYHANSNSWMTMAIFESFLRMLDTKMRSMKRKILLFIDQCPAHPADTSYLSHVKVVFFPSNCTSHLQPLDQGIIRCVKQCYRKRIVYDRLASLEAPKKISVLDAMNFLNSAWNSIDASTVINCFNKSGFCRKLSDSAVVEDTDESVTISKEWQQIAGTNATFSDYVDCDSSLFAFQQSSLKEILEQHQADANQEDNDDDGDKEQEALPIPTLTAALEAMDTVRRYVCSFNVDENVINQLSKIDTVICKLGKKT